MKRFETICGLISLVLATGMMLSLVACNGVPQEDPTPEAESCEPREIYEDASFDTVTAYRSTGKKTCTVQAEGQQGVGELVLDFSRSDGSYVLSPIRLHTGCHNVAECEECGYRDGSYRMESAGEGQGGMTVTLAVPVQAMSVARMQLTFRTTADAPDCEMRILPIDCTDGAGFINTCGNMGGATQEFTTVDLGVGDFSKLADEDGYIRSFQIYFRNKNQTDCYVQSIAFTLSPQQYLKVDAVSGNCFFREGALEAVAKVIAARFEAAGIAATITVNQKKYTANSAASDGHLHYGANAVLSDGTKLSLSHDLAIPALCGAWLDATDGQYGSAHDSHGQWQQTLDPGGLLFLTDNQISCADGIVGMEYAVIPADGAHDAPEVIWRAPQLLQMSEQGFDYLFVNAALDMHGTLVKGERYRLLVRGVSTNGNFVLHTDVAFTYSPLSSAAQDALCAAYGKVQNAALTCSDAETDRMEAIRTQLIALIDDPNVGVAVSAVGTGLHSMRVAVSLRYLPEICESRLPEYVWNGRRIASVYDFDGEAFTVNGVTVRYGESEGSIALTAPYDGDAHVILANELIYDHAKAPISRIESVTYGYTREELCTPPAVRLCWTDVNAAAGKTYTVSISESLDMSGATVLTVSDTYAQVYNLKVGTQYYWQVRAGNEVSLIHTFTTEDGYPRFIDVDGVSNVRDIGGYYTADGKCVKQGMAFRSAHLDGITEEGRKVALEQLGIRTDLDLRGGGSAPLGDSVRYVAVAMQWYDHIFEKQYREDVCDAIRAFAYEENYPIVFHCSMGRDRTGTTAYLILGLLGVEEETLLRDYYASFFSTAAAFDTEEFPLLVSSMNRLSKELGKYGNENDPLQKKIEAYLLDIGVTAEEIANIRAILLEE